MLDLGISFPDNLLLLLKSTYFIYICTHTSVLSTFYITNMFVTFAYESVSNT